ncbi:GH32 C-terminal domain-containing protein [Halalkalibacter kiskunsagensis]|uniref:GH32 C-terminal domain-containing protein n=1 Tax=Halalkalibacter kiskunsagensis TaxID=1548599 RepID=A0ABV6KBH6_9BACI
MKKRYILIFVTTLIIIVGYVSETRLDVASLAAATDEYYTEKYRPQYHFSTTQGRLADPNGLIYFEGEYHLFHQKMGTWAHAVSKDMLHWEHLPIALEHDELGQALSGTSVIDWNDTTGFFDGEAGMVAIYTSTEGGESQGIAYSKNNGRTWERYEGNPVIENPGIKDFRDPKVFWHDETEKWVMAVTTDKSVTFYNSPNLIDWQYQSEFGVDEQGNEHGTHVAVWETPDLFRLPVDGNEENQKWVLTVSIGDNHVTDGSTNQYFIGEFDGYKFTNDNQPEEVLITDFGQDFYAAQSFNELAEGDDRRIWLAWMANWRYPYQSPTYPWMGSMSIPREVTLRTIEDGSMRLFQEPIRELKDIRATEHSIDSFTLEGEKKIEDFSGVSYEFEAVIEWEDVQEFGIRLRQSDEEETVVGVDLNSETVFLDRTKAGLDTLIDRNGEKFQFGKRFEADFPTEREQIKIRGLVDESSVELFIDDGEMVFTNLIYTKPTNRGIELYAEGGSVEVVSLDFFHLHSTWREAPAEGEIERIVVSEEYLNVNIGESKELIANVKPDWLSEIEPFEWEIREPGMVEINKIDDTTVLITGVEPGITNLTIRDPNGNRSKEMIIRTSDGSQSAYTDGWGPSPISGEHSGHWKIINESSVTSLLGHSHEWAKMYREELMTGDFSVSADIEWVNQGAEGFPKYGLTITDEERTMVSAFFNKDINMLETYAEVRGEAIGWEGVKLPQDINLQEAQALKVKKSGDTFTFYFNDKEMYERKIEMAGDMSVGIITENTEAHFTNYFIQSTSASYRLRDLIEMVKTAGITPHGIKQASLTHLDNAQAHFESAQQLYEEGNVSQATTQEEKGYESVQKFVGYLQKRTERQIEEKKDELVRVANYIMEHETESWNKRQLKE